MKLAPRCIYWSAGQKYSEFKLHAIQKAIVDGDSIILWVCDDFIENMSNLDDDLMKELLEDLGRSTVKKIYGKFMGEPKTSASSERLKDLFATASLSSERLKDLYATIGAKENLEYVSLEFKLRYTDLCRAAVQSLSHASHIHLKSGHATWGEDAVAVEVDPTSGQLVERRALEGQKPTQHLAALQNELEKLALALKQSTLTALALEISTGVYPVILPALFGHPSLTTVALIGDDIELSPNAFKALADLLSRNSAVDVKLSKFVPADLLRLLSTAQVNSINFDGCDIVNFIDGKTKKSVLETVLRALLGSNVKAINLKRFLSYKTYRSEYKDIMVAEIPAKEILHELAVWASRESIALNEVSMPTLEERKGLPAALADIDAAVLAVMKAAALRTDLKVVKWWMNSFSLEVVQTLAECMHNNKGLQEIWLSVLSTTADAQHALVEELETNCTLQHVHLVDRSRGGNRWNEDVKNAAESLPQRTGAGRADSMTKSQINSVLAPFADGDNMPKSSSSLFSAGGGSDHHGADSNSLLSVDRVWADLPLLDGVEKDGVSDGIRLHPFVRMTSDEGAGQSSNTPNQSVVVSDSESEDGADRETDDTNPRRVVRRVGRLNRLVSLTRWGRRARGN